MASQRSALAVFRQMSRRRLCLSGTSGRCNNSLRPRPVHHYSPLFTNQYRDNSSDIRAELSEPWDDTWKDVDAAATRQEANRKRTGLAAGGTQTYRPSDDTSKDRKRPGAVLMGSLIANTPSLENELPPPRVPAKMKLGASAGRRIYVDKSMDVAGAIGKVNIGLSLNGIRREFNQQKFHERPGLKRKRLKRERWRTSFALGFRAIVAKVRKMRAQGW